MEGHYHVWTLLSDDVAQRKHWWATRQAAHEWARRHLTPLGKSWFVQRCQRSECPHDPPERLDVGRLDELLRNPVARPKNRSRRVPFTPSQRQKIDEVAKARGEDWESYARRATMAAVKRDRTAEDST